MGEGTWHLDRPDRAGLRPALGPDQPEHAGGDRPKTGVKWLGDDNSRFPQQRQLGPALSVPRYPSNIYYNTSTRAEQLDEYNYLYLPPELGGVCQNSSTTTCFSKRATWNEYVDREASQMLRHAARQRPAPALRAPGQPGRRTGSCYLGHGRGPDALPLLLQDGDRSADAEGSGPDASRRRRSGTSVSSQVERLPPERQDRR